MNLATELVTWVQGNPQQFAVVAAVGFSLLQSTFKPAGGWGQVGVWLSVGYSVLVGLLTTLAAPHDSNFFALASETFLAAQLFFMTHKVENPSSVPDGAKAVTAAPVVPENPAP